MGSWFSKKKISPPKAPPPVIATPPPITKKTKEELIYEARIKYGIDCVNKYNFGIVGASGTGKSSIINAFRGLNDSDVGAALVGEVETTSKPTPYIYPNHNYVVFWDIPGGGTTNHPGKTYFEDKALYAFDCLVVITADRFTEIDLNLGKQAKDWGTPILFVRSKADIALQSKKRRGLTAQQASTELRSDVSKMILPQLEKVGLVDRTIYILSAWAYLDESVPQMDEQRLVDDMVNIGSRRINK